jgi:hypothetical protein
MTNTEECNAIFRAAMMEATLESIIEICRYHQKNRHGHPNFNAEDIARLAEKALEKEGGAA